MTLPDPTPYDWLLDELGDAACLTAVTPGTTPLVAEAMGVDLDEPVEPHSVEWLGGAVGFTDLEGAVLAVEPNGFRGNEDDLLASLSGTGRSASVYWNVNGVVRFACAEEGRALCNFELWFDADGLPPELEPLHALVSDRPGSPPLEAVGMAMVAAFTGVVVDASSITTAWTRCYAAAGLRS